VGFCRKISEGRKSAWFLASEDMAEERTPGRTEEETRTNVERREK